MKKLTMLFALALSMNSLQAQLLDYIPGDENYSLTLAFHRTDTLLVVVPDDYCLTDQEKSYIESYVFWDQYQKKPVYAYREEGELRREDLAGKLQFYGPFCEFQFSVIGDIPFRQVVGGFSFDGEEFTGAGDSFFYINEEATRLFTCRNSTDAPNHYADFAAGYFQLYIFRGDELYESGFCPADVKKKRINDISHMRREYFEYFETGYFTFSLARSVYSDSLANVIREEADNCMETLCDLLGVDTEGMDGMTTYIYGDMSDLQEFLCMSPRMTIYGKSIGSVNHVSVFDMAVFKHELAHTVISRKVGLQSNSFFSEGFAVYTGYYLGESAYQRDLVVAGENSDLLSVENITGPDHRFYSLPDMYPVSGVFTRFVIDRIGMDVFKRIYACENIEKAFADSGFPLPVLIAEFKEQMK